MAAGDPTCWCGRMLPCNCQTFAAPQTWCGNWGVPAGTTVEWTGGFTTQRISDEDIDRIAKRVVELLKESQ